MTTDYDKKKNLRVGTRIMVRISEGTEWMAATIEEIWCFQHPSAVRFNVQCDNGLNGGGIRPSNIMIMEES